MIPVFLLLTALVVDVGTGTRTSASSRTEPMQAAFAAGVEYATTGRPACRRATPALSLDTAATIADAARQYAGDPEAADYARVSLPEHAPKHRDREPGER